MIGIAELNSSELIYLKGFLVRANNFRNQEWILGNMVHLRKEINNKKKKIFRFKLFKQVNIYMIDGVLTNRIVTVWSEKVLNRNLFEIKI